MSNKKKINKAKDIISDIFSLTQESKDTYELDKATDAMYDYIKSLENE